MPIILKVLSYKGLPLPAELKAEFDEFGGTIGRRTGNTLLLPDAENFVSGHHAEIIYRDGDYLLKDTSKNGTLLSTSGVNVNNTEAVLLEREILRIGEYEVIVEKPAESLPTSVPNFDSISASPFAEAFPIDNQSIISAPLNLPTSHTGSHSPFGDRPPASPFHDSFIPPAVVPVQTADTDIATFLKGLDSLGELDASVNAAPVSEFPNLEPIDLPKPLPPKMELESRVLFQNPTNIERVDPPAPVPQDQDVAMKPLPSREVSINSSLSDAALMHMFLEGAGISDHAFLNKEQWPEAMRATGVLFRNLIEGLMDVLRARAEMKSEFRVSVTTIRSFDNNPLKFNPDVESVLKLMLAPNNPAFINSNDAINEAFKDVKFHQLAMTAGIQAALGEILRRFDPDTFDKTLGEGIVFQRKAKCWELFCERYPELKAQAIEGFFGEEFAEAYEKQMRLFARR